MPRRVYHHGHTAAIRARLAHLAITGLIGLLLAAVAAVVILVIGRAGCADPPTGLVRTFWILDAIAAVVSVATSALALVGRVCSTSGAGLTSTRRARRLWDSCRRGWPTHVVATGP